MPENKPFHVNDFEHLDEAQEPGRAASRESNGWGFVREDLVKYGVRMVTNVNFTWDESTPPEMRKVLGEASHVIHHIAETAIMRQLEFDRLKPTETRDVLYGAKKDQPDVILRDSGWHPVE